jgi:hypothetical protein
MHFLDAYYRGSSLPAFYQDFTFMYAGVGQALSLRHASTTHRQQTSCP